MNIESILTRERTHANIQAASKKRAIEKAAIFIAETDDSLDTQDVYNHLIAREKLGTTALGFGIAIPHCRLPACQKITGGLFTLEEPVDFDAFDDQLVSTLFVILVPEDEVEEHLKVLGALAGRFEDENFRKRLTRARTNDDLYNVMVEAFKPDA
ncbi:MAG: PTS sugar transporter subunit IIA [Pseudomonadales bacterium]|nr:PTS sugar transporter subunit IIA [Pseudomonadales bacterium]